MEDVILYIHSALRYVLVIMMICSLVTAYTGLLKAKVFTTGNGKLYAWTLRILDIQALLGIILYFSMGFQSLLGSMGSLSDKGRFFTMDHIAGMIIGLAVMHIGGALSGKSTTDKAKFQKIAIFFTIGFLIIFFSIPWPFLKNWAGWFTV